MRVWIGGKLVEIEHLSGEDLSKLIRHNMDRRAVLDREMHAFGQEERRRAKADPEGEAG